MTRRHGVKVLHGAKVQKDSGRQLGAARFNRRLLAHECVAKKILSPYAAADVRVLELGKVHELAARIPEILQPYLDTAIPEFGENGSLDATEAKSLLLKM